MADPVYNTADQRLERSQSTPFNSSQLGRLPASAKEVEASLEILGGKGWSTEIKSGLDANSVSLRQVLDRSPDILHLSAHFVSQSENPHLLSVALSPAPGSSLTSLFSSLDLNSVRTKIKLVVLSGCSTSSGEVVPSIGINGLSRAFLISGADSVLATQWPTLDTNGPIFSAFYHRLTQQAWSSRAAASALRAAQLQMISQRGWTANPAYWAAYLVLSKG